MSDIQYYYYKSLRIKKTLDFGNIISDNQLEISNLLKYLWTECVGYLLKLEFLSKTDLK